jgi:phospholipase/carboxylesterase
MGVYNHLERGTWSGNQADLVVILLHGMSGSSARTIVYAEELAERLPNAHFYAPDASNPYIAAEDPKTPDMDPDPKPGRFMWYSRYSEETRQAGLYKTLELLDTYIDECVAAHSLDRSRAVIMGFSQGAIVSNFCVPRFAVPIGTAISHSGYLFGPDSLARRRTQIPLFKSEVINCTTAHSVIHGMMDATLPWQTGLETASIMEECGIPVEFHLLSGLKHADFESRTQAIALEFVQRHIYTATLVNASV